MGAWGIGPFENDAAADFMLEYEEGGVGVVVDALEAVIAMGATGYIDADIGSSGLAAAEVFATSNGRPAADLDGEVLKVITIHQSEVAASEPARALSVRALELIESSGETSELLGLWQGSDMLSGFVAGVDDLKSRLEVRAQ